MGGVRGGAKQDRMSTDGATGTPHHPSTLEHEDALLLPELPLESATEMRDENVEMADTDDEQPPHELQEGGLVVAPNADAALVEIPPIELMPLSNVAKIMAMELPEGHHHAGMRGGSNAIVGASGHVSRVLKRIRRRALQSSRALTPSEAPSVLGYTDVNHLGNFVLDSDGKRRPVAYGPSERLAVNVPYSRLEAFPVRARATAHFQPSVALLSDSRRACARACAGAHR